MFGTCLGSISSIVNPPGLKREHNHGLISIFLCFCVILKKKVKIICYQIITNNVEDKKITLTMTEIVSGSFQWSGFRQCFRHPVPVYLRTYYYCLFNQLNF